jgi:heme-degrading monooxygenase HmoA
MHAVVVRVNIADFEASRKDLREKVVPRVSQAPGFVAGYWTRSDDGRGGLSMIIFESEEAARAGAEQIPSNIPDTVTLENVEVREVVEHA